MESLEFRKYRKRPVVISAARLENGDYLAIGTADERYVIPGDVFPTIYDPVDEEDAISARPDAPAETHAVIVGDDQVFTGSYSDCQTWAESNAHSGYGIARIS